MANRKTKKMSIEELLALAAEPVPLGSGLTLCGTGAYIYMKTNRFDYSTRVFRFRSARMMQRAMRIGMDADTDDSQAEVESQDFDATGSGYGPN